MIVSNQMNNVMDKDGDRYKALDILMASISFVPLHKHVHRYALICLNEKPSIKKIKIKKNEKHQNYKEKHTFFNNANEYNGNKRV